MRLTTPHGILSSPFPVQGELCLWCFQKCYPCLRYTCYLCPRSIQKRERGGFETRNPKPDTRKLCLLIRLDPADKSVRKAPFDVDMVVVFVPSEVILFQARRQFRRFIFQFLSNLQPVLTGRNTVHSLLIESVGQNVGSGNAIASFCQQTLDTARSVKPKIIAMRAPKHLIDLGLKSDVDRVLRLLDHGVKNHEPAPIF